MADSPNVEDDAADGESPKPSRDKDADKKLLELARARFKVCADATRDIRTAATDDLKFLVGDQWPESIKKARDLDERPTPVINGLPAIVRQVTNDQKQNRPGLKADPIGDGADVDTAEVKTGLLRHIEVKSKAKLAYDTAFASAVQGSFGAWRVRADYRDPMSFDQELIIDALDNPFLVYLDPSYKKPDGSDANFGFIIEDLSEEEFNEQYPNSEPVSADDFKVLGDEQAPYWRTDKTVRVAEYLYKDFKEITIGLLSDDAGTTIDLDNLATHPDGGLVTKDGKQAWPAGTKILKRRKTKVPTVKWVKMSGIEILESADTVFDLWLPIFPVIGERFNIDGEVILKSLVRDAKDPQRNRNYWEACKIETISLAPRTPWVAAEGQIEGYEDVWETAHKKNHAVLPYVPFSLDGTPCPPPQRQTFEPPVSAVTNAAAGSVDDIKAVTGIYDAGLGRNVNDQSGVAINSLKNQGQTSNFHFIDNLHLTMEHCGRVLIRAIPKVYDGERMERILRMDGTTDVVALNHDPAAMQQGKKTYDMVKGEYDAVIDTGPSFETKRQQGQTALIELSKAIPQIPQLCGDLIAKGTDAPYMNEVAKRLKAALPPGVADQDDGQQQLPPQIRAELDKNSKLVEALSKANNDLHEAIERKKFEIDSKERIAMRDFDVKERQIQVQLEIAIAQLQSKEGLGLLQITHDQIKHDIDTSTAQAAQAAQAEADAAQSEAQENNAPPPNSQSAGSAGAAPSNPTGGATPGQSMGQP